jgi:glutathione S-transferase
MLKIYGFKTFNLDKVLITAEEIGLQYEYIHLNPANAEHKTPDHLKRHPLGKVPAIEIDGKFLFESNSICRYLVLENNSDLYAGSAWDKAQVDQWIDFMTLHAGRWLSIFYFQRVIKPRFSNAPEDEEAINEAAGFLDQQIPVIDKQLGNHIYLAGDQFSLADIIAFSYFNTHELTNVDLGQYQNLLKWHDAIKNRPAYGKARANYPQ